LLQVTPLKNEYLEDAASLVSKRYKQLREQVPLLPSRYEEVDTLLPQLRNILNASGIGVAALDGGRLVGFLAGWQLASFRGKRSTYSPEWANAADLENSARIYQELYSQLAAVWQADGYDTHYISLFPNDVKALGAWHWLGFGMISVDALCGMDPLLGSEVDLDIRRAEPSDLDLVIEFHDALRNYMTGTPVFLQTEKKDRSYLEEWLRNPEKDVWLAYRKAEPVAFMRFGPADHDVCTIIIDEKTTSIYAAFTKDKAREEGVATALLARALQSARDSGYERCAVPFEPMNILGSRFWLKHFDPVCYSVVRYLDHRLTQIGDPD